jgi:hypothetical protein
MDTSAVRYFRVCDPAGSATLTKSFGITDPAHPAVHEFSSAVHVHPADTRTATIIHRGPVAAQPAADMFIRRQFFVQATGQSSDRSIVSFPAARSLKDAFSDYRSPC